MRGAIADMRRQSTWGRRCPTGSIARGSPIWMLKLAGLLNMMGTALARLHCLLHERQNEQGAATLSAATP